MKLGEGVFLKLCVAIKRNTSLCVLFDCLSTENSIPLESKYISLSYLHWGIKYLDVTYFVLFGYAGIWGFRMCTNQKGSKNSFVGFHKWKLRTKKGSKNVHGVYLI